MRSNVISKVILSFLIITATIFKLGAQKRSFINNPFLHLQHPVGANAGGWLPRCVIHAPYRTLNGSNNNISSTSRQLWGSANIALYRELAPAYGAADINNAMAGSSRPSARKISNAVISEPVTIFNERGLSAFVYVWGQFIDHDMSLTPTGATAYEPIALPPEETVFTEEIPFYRSEVYPGTGTTDARQQSNLNTAWIDASMVYGQDSARAKWLRTLTNGKMKTSAGNLLPWNTYSGEQSAAIDPAAPLMANDNGHTVKTYVCGDTRAAEHPGITALHTLFIREHNAICKRLMYQGFKNDEEIYQRARKEVGALIQVITYQEFLPAIGITLRSYKRYNMNVRPDIANSFATAGYRLGHTMVADDIFLFDNNCAEVGPGELDLLEAFWRPELVFRYNAEPFLKGLASHTQYETDTKINTVLRNFLFNTANDTVRFGIDLGSLNIQRGRDHGLPDYNTVRKYYTGRAARSFSDITSDTALADSLKVLYGNVDNIDLWVGLLAEDHLPGTSVGKTVHEMLRVQFENLRDGDYYFYKNDPYLRWSIKTKIEHTRLSDVIKRNSGLINLQSNVFFTQECDTTEAVVGNRATLPILTNSTIKIYPNPVNNVLTINLAGMPGVNTIKIISTKGQVIKAIRSAENNLQINMSGYTKGIYFLNVAGYKHVESLKFIKL